jgi:hypothetical protein
VEEYTWGKQSLSLKHDRFTQYELEDWNERLIYYSFARSLDPECGLSVLPRGCQSDSMMPMVAGSLTAEFICRIVEVHLFRVAAVFSPELLPKKSLCQSDKRFRHQLTTKVSAQLNQLKQLVSKDATLPAADGATTIFLRDVLRRLSKTQYTFGSVQKFAKKCYSEPWGILELLILLAVYETLVITTSSKASCINKDLRDNLARIMSKMNDREDVPGFICKCAKALRYKYVSCHVCHDVCSIPSCSRQS